MIARAGRLQPVQLDRRVAELDQGVTKPLESEDCRLPLPGYVEMKTRYPRRLASTEASARTDPEGTTHETLAPSRTDARADRHAPHSRSHPRQPLPSRRLRPGFFSGNINSCSSGGKSVEAVLGLPGPWNGANSGSWPATTVSGDGLVVTISNVTTVGGQLVFDWSSNLPVDLAIVKQGNGGAYWVYNPAVTSGTLASYKDGNPSGGVSHVLFCYHPGAQGPSRLLVSKTAETQVKKTYSWSIDEEGEGREDAAQRPGRRCRRDGELRGRGDEGARLDRVLRQRRHHREERLDDESRRRNGDGHAAGCNRSRPGAALHRCVRPRGRRDDRTARTPPTCRTPMLASTRRSRRLGIGRRSRTAAERRVSGSTTTHR